MATGLPILKNPAQHFSALGHTDDALESIALLSVLCSTGPPSPLLVFLYKLSPLETFVPDLRRLSGCWLSGGSEGMEKMEGNQPVCAIGRAN